MGGVKQKGKYFTGVEGLCPNCEYVELKNQAGVAGVRGFSKTKVCSPCQAQVNYDSQQAAINNSRSNNNLMIAEKQRKMAIDALKAEGKLGNDY